VTLNKPLQGHFTKSLGLTYSLNCYVGPTEQCNVGMSKVSRRTDDTGTSLVADGMGAKTMPWNK